MYLLTYKIRFRFRQLSTTTIYLEIEFYFAKGFFLSFFQNTYILQILKYNYLKKVINPKFSCVINFWSFFVDANFEYNPHNNFQSSKWLLKFIFQLVHILPSTIKTAMS